MVVVGLTGGGVLDNIVYDANGGIRSETNAAARGDVGFQGGRYDAGIGDWLFGLRDEQSGRWTTMDPSGLGPDSDPYRFVGNGPTDGTDPSGLQPGSYSPYSKLPSLPFGPTATPNPLDQLKELADLANPLRSFYQNRAAGVATSPLGDNDKAGADVTMWFARDILAHIQQRQADMKWLRPLQPEDIASDLTRFKFQAKYLMSPKWYNFEGQTGTGTGQETVTLCQNVVIRKNQLGNIEFALICNLLPLINPITDADWMVKYGYDGGKTYDTSHPYANGMFGKECNGLTRYDNLAAFGVGYEIAKRIKDLPAWRNGDVTADQIAGILTDVLGRGNEKTLGEACQHYAKWAPDPQLLGLQSLTFIPNFYSPGELPKGLRGSQEYDLLRGYNTMSLKPSTTIFEGKKTSIDYYYGTLRPAFDRSGRPDIDAWLPQNYENYGGATPSPRKK